MRYILILFIISYTSLFPQTDWFPSKLNIQPFTANFLEAKAGFSYMIGEEKIRLDIGITEDILHFVSSDKVFSFGADLFTYTRLRGTDEFHFPVEAIDYLFGLNAGYKNIIRNNQEYGLRIRLSHISAHFVDGHYDYIINGWRNGRHPRVYSREFLEFIPYYKIEGLRVYAGYTYLLHVSPDDLGKSIFQTGFDYFYSGLDLPFTPFAAYDFKLAKVSKYHGNNIFSAGLKFGNVTGKGFSILFSYISGASLHGEYFDFYEKYSTLGFNIDL